MKTRILSSAVYQYAGESHKAEWAFGYEQQQESTPEAGIPVRGGRLFLIAIVTAHRLAFKLMRLQFRALIA